MKRLSLILILLFAAISLVYAQNPSEPTISTVDGEQRVCIRGIFHILPVQINFPPNYTSDVDSFVIRWGVASFNENRLSVDRTTSPLRFNLRFDFPGVYQDCQPEFEGIVRLDTYRDGDPNSKNNLFIPTFKVPPVAKINDDSLVICLGETFLFDGAESCPNNITEYEWTIDGQKFYGKQVSYTFLTPGNKTVTLKVTNQCGTSEDQVVINVRPLPEAIADADADIVNGNYVICLNDNEVGVIEVDGSKSKNANRLEWTVIDPPGGSHSISEVIPLIPNQAKKKIRFFSKGIYQVVLKASMPCNNPDYDTITVEVLDREPVSLTPISDTCGPISYSPPTNIAGTKYFINGQPATNFPRTLNAGTYKIKATFENRCGPSADSIEFTVFEAQDTRILSPGDTVVCRGSGAIPLVATPATGRFVPSPFITGLPGATFFNPGTVGIYTVTFSTGIGACIRRDSIRIEVVDAVVLELNPQEDVCNSVSYRPQPTVPGAVYTINGNPVSSFPFNASAVGTYIVKATLSNTCGTSTLSDTFNVTAPVDVFFITPANDTTLCKGNEEVEIKVNIPGGAFSPAGKIVTRNDRYFFTPSVTESFTLTYSFGIANCSRSASTNITVIDEVPLNLDLQADACESINYQPQPFNAQATYKIDGVTISSFPVLLNTSKEYLVEASLQNECGTKTLRDTFEVTVPQDVFFITPAKDTVLCLEGPEFEVQVSVPGGTFVPVDGLDVRGNGAYYAPVLTGEFSLIYSQGFDLCERKDTVTIRVVDGVPLELKPQADVCNTFEYSPDPFDPAATYTINGIEQSTFPFTLTEAKTYFVTATLANECGSRTLSDTFELFVPLDVRILSPASDTIVCVENGSLPIIGSVNGGAFSQVPGLQVNGDTAQLSMATPGRYVIYYSQGFDDCFRQDSVVVEVVESNILVLDEQEDVCDELSYTPSPLNPLAVYTINGNEEQNFPIALSPGNYNVLATLTDACGVKEKSIDFAIYRADDVQISGTRDTVVCAGSGMLPLVASLSQAVFSGEQLEVINDLTYFNPVNAGVFTIYLVLDLNSCSLTDSVTIEVIGLAPKADSFRVCNGTEVIDLTASPAGGVWTSPTCPSCLGGDVFTVPQAGNYEAVVVYTLTNDIGCVATDTGLITVLEPKSVFQLEGAACSSNVNFNTDGTVADERFWYINDSLVGQPPFVGLATGSYQIKLVAAVEQCSDSSTLEIFVIEPPLAAADFTIVADSVCTPHSFSPQPLSPEESFLSYEWVITYDGLTSVFEGYQLAGGFEFVNNTPFDKQATVQYRSFNVCDTITKDTMLTILAIPESQIGIDSSRTGCSPYTIALSNRSDGRYEDCFWIIEGDTIRNCSPFINYTFTTEDTAKTYFIELFVSNECGGTSFFDSITVVPPGVIAFFNTPDYEVCPNTEVQFEDASTPRPISWYWSFGDGTISEEPNPTHTYTQANQIFEVKLVVTTGCGYDSISRFIETKDIPAVDFIIPIYGCQFQQVDSIIQTSYLPGQRFVWDFGNGIKDSTNINPRPLYDEGERSYSITLTVFDAETACPNSRSKDLEIKNKPSINFLLDSLICYKDEIEILNNTLYANDYIWYYNNTPIQQSQDPLIIFNETGEQLITLIASFNGRCVDSISKVVFVRRCEVYIPNLFTPNNDGKNDFFTAYGGVNVRMIRKMKIFDRWGALVFEKEDVPPNVEVLGWDGSLPTRSQSFGATPAVFMYWMEIEFIDGETEFFKGDVTLMR
jgi:gliding motility-associated-like protein